MFSYTQITEILDKSIENEHELALVFNTHTAAHLRTDELKNYTINENLLYCGSWIIDINSIVAINDLTAEMEALRMSDTYKYMEENFEKFSSSMGMK